MRRLSDAEIVARCLDGSEDAFASLVDGYKDLVFGVISQVVTDRTQVEDLAQEVFFKVHKGLPAFRGDAKLSTWIYRVAFGALERRDRLEKAIGCLPVEQRFLIAAHYFGEQQYQELADILEMPVGTVKTLLHRAKQRLRKLMSEGGEL